MSVPVEPWAKWIEPADALLKQAYYRILGMISWHAPINESVEAIRWLAENRRGGTLTYFGRTALPLTPELPVGRFFSVYSWDNVEPFLGVKMNTWVIGSDQVQNTAYLRKQWWRMYIVESMLKRAGLGKEVITSQEQLTL